MYHEHDDSKFPSMEGYPSGRGGMNSNTNHPVALRHPSTGGEKQRSTKNYLLLPYNPKLRERAKELRKAGNLAEVLLWSQVKKKQFLGLDFDRQKIIGNYIVDFYCPNLDLVIEIDGSSHDNKYEYDKERDLYLDSLGLKVIHFTDTDVKNNIDLVLKYLRDCVEFPSGGGVAERRGGFSKVIQIQTTPPYGHPSIEGN